MYLSEKNANISITKHPYEPNWQFPLGVRANCKKLLCISILSILLFLIFLAICKMDNCCIFSLRVYFLRCKLPDECCHLTKMFLLDIIASIISDSWFASKVQLPKECPYFQVSSSKLSGDQGTRQHSLETRNESCECLPKIFWQVC